MPSSQQPKPVVDCANQANVTLQVLKDYAVAAALLQNAKSIGSGPWRFMILHSTELCLNALLHFHGHDGDCIRKLQHSFDKRLEIAKTHGLKLRKKTVEHLQAVDQRKEYVLSRYETVVPREFSQTNRLTATLEEVAGKVAKLIAPHGNVIAPPMVSAQAPRATSAKKRSA